MGREWQWFRSLAGAGEHQEESSSSATTSGCMSGMLHYFDFQHLLLFAGAAGSRKGSPDRHPSSQPPAIKFTPDQLKGLEAPRNSLELDERRVKSASSAIDEDLSDVAIGFEVLPTPANKNKKNMLMLLEEERKTSSQAETPRSSNIVARLMGLEVLPDGTSTSPASANGTKTLPPPLRKKKSGMKTINFSGDQTRKTAAPRQPLQSLNCNVSGSRSLPESPRVSTASRSFDGDPRLSLQINKENNNLVDLPTIIHSSSSLPPSPSPSTTPKSRKKESLLKLQDENRNTPANDRGGRFGGQAGTKSKRTPAAEKKVICESNVRNETSNSSSSSPTTQIRVLKSPLSISSQSKQKEKVVLMIQKKCTKASNERFTERIKKPSSQSLSSLSSFFQSSPSSITSALPDKKQASKNLKWGSNPSSPATSTVRKEASPPSPATQEKELMKIEQARKQVFEPDLAEYRYVKSILEHADPTFRWYSTSLPIDPIIFHHIELEIELDEKKDQCELLRGTMRYKWNRKLLFHLVEELLGDFLLRWSSKHPAAASGEETWLLQPLWARIRSFPAANCRVIADIDALVAGDLAEANTRRLLHHPAVVEEAENVVAVVEQEILRDLLGDAYVLMTSLRTTRSRLVEVVSKSNLELLIPSLSYHGSRHAL